MSIETGDELRARIQAIDLTMMGFARVMRMLGDPRDAQMIWRGIQRMVSGATRVSPEMHIILRVIEGMPRDQVQEIAKDFHWGAEATGPETKVRRWDFGFLKVTSIDER